MLEPPSERLKKVTRRIVYLIVVDFNLGINHKTSNLWLWIFQVLTLKSDGSAVENFGGSSRYGGYQIL
jgi:hypothetical protein